MSNYSVKARGAKWPARGTGQDDHMPLEHGTYLYPCIKRQHYERYSFGTSFIHLDIRDVHIVAQSKGIWISLKWLRTDCVTFLSRCILCSPPHALPRRWRWCWMWRRHLPWCWRFHQCMSDWCQLPCQPLALRSRGSDSPRPEHSVITGECTQICRISGIILQSLPRRGVEVLALASLAVD